MPAAFFGHGSPMNALEHNRYTEAWAAFGHTLPRPRAIVAISAHWYIQATAVTAMAAPRTIHDFFGFPDELFAYTYDAPGAPDVADEIVDAVRPTWVGLDLDSWGLDHGTWSVLAHVLPAADVPVVQLAVNALQPLDYHFELGVRLAPLRDRGVVIVGSGNVVHNLAAIDPTQRKNGFDWAVRFNEAVEKTMREAPADIAGLGQHRDFALAAPSPDHFLPLAYLAGLAAAAGRVPDVAVDGYAYGSLSMTSFVLS
jgi:4,5-DOPA dioxygenase extradiol